MGYGKREEIDFALLFALIGICMFIYVFLTGCALTPPIDVKKQSEETYRKDMKVVIDGVEYTGVGVLPIQTSYKITLKPKEKSDRILIMNCHRSLTIDKPKTGWFKTDYTFNFTPLSDVETNKVCSLEIAALNENTKNSFAFFEFDDTRPEITLQGFVKCNGVYEVSRNGVSICQSAEGLTQQIFFQEKVLLGDIDPSCNIPETNDYIFWTFVPNKNKCAYYFVANKRAKNGKRMAHRLTTIGYSSIPYPME